MRGRTQRYKCKDCGRRFDGDIRRDKAQVISDYVDGKQTLGQPASKYGVCEKTIRRDLEGMRYIHKIARHKDVTVQIGTTYWGRVFGLMVTKDALRGVVLWHKYVRHETVAQYAEGIEWLKGNGFRIYGIVIDGMKGLPQALKPIPVQMCQFHQAMIVRRYLTSKPELPAAIELMDIANMLAHTDKESFIGMLDDWGERWTSFMGERSTDLRTGKTSYTHKRLRSAYLRRNMPWQ